MRRRQFLNSLAYSGYSVVVFAGQIPGAGQPRETRAPAGARRWALAGEPHMALVDLETDFLVAGGGLAGVCAAVAAARHGAKVVLVQDRSRLGGNSSSEVKMHVCGAVSSHPGWREGGLVEEFQLDDCVHNPQRCFELWDLRLYDKVISEPNITLLLESTLYAAQRKGDRIDHVLVRCDKSERIYRIRAKMFCDATGDCRLGLEAGAEMRTGREARGEFNEPLAPEKADEETLGSSILFTSRLHRRPMPFTPPKWARKLGREHFQFRKISSWEYGYWWIAWGGDKDVIQDNERIRFELLAVVMGVWDHIKNSGEFPDAANYALDWVGMIPGKRGSRRLVGDYILTQHDLLRGDIEDAVALGGWPMDDHPPAGFDRPDLKPNIAIRTPDVYNIPLRSLYSRNISNLMMAGRNISCSHVAFTSSRVMATCASVGQAAGTAAAMCIQHGMSPRRIYEKKEHLLALQQTLLRDDQTIRDRKNEDPLDLARRAKVTASAEDGEGRAANVIDGIPLDIPRKQGKEIHHWAARMSEGGVWIELAWDNPQRIRQVQLTWDTGFQRRLMLSGSDEVTRTTVRAPQPETVRDYTISLRRPGSQELTPVVKVEGNYQRLNRHSIEPVEAAALRIHITATNGDDLARLLAVRCYA